MRHHLAVRSILTGTLTASLTSVMLLSAPFGHATDNDPTSSPTAYTAWLATKTWSGDTEARTTLTKFNRLSSADKTKFLDYLKDPSLSIKFAQFTAGTIDDSAPDLSVPSDPADNPPSPFTSVDETPAMAAAQGDVVNTTSLAGGDVVMEATAGLTDADGSTQTPYSQGKAADWHASYSVKDKFLGITITEVKIWVDYHSNKTRVTKMYNCNGSYKNYVPLSDFKMGTPKKWISAAGNAHGEISWTADFMGESWSAVEHIWADETGFRGGSLK